MPALVVYESMFGNTRAVAEAIAHGIGGDARAVPVGQVSKDEVRAAEIVVVGAPTHAFGLPRPSTRTAAAKQASGSGGVVTFEGHPEAPGLREWLATVDLAGRPVAAFDTRVHSPVPLPHAAPKIAKALRKRGADLLVLPRGFWVGKENKLADDQLGAAREFGRSLAHLHARAPRG